MTYTEHKLTDAQLRRLSAIVNNTNGMAQAGTAGNALIRKGLVRELWREEVRSLYEEGPSYIRRVFDGREATDAGREALAQARREGW